MKRTKAVVEKITGDSITILAGEEEREMVVSMDEPTLPGGLKEGDWLEIEIADDKVRILGINEEETRQVKTRIQEKMDLLRKRSAASRDDTQEKNGNPNGHNKGSKNT